MNKSSLIITITAVALIVLIGVVLLLQPKSAPVVNVTQPAPATKQDPANISYVVDGTTFSLKDGTAEIPYTTNSASKATLKLFSEPVYGDLNADGVPDAAVLLVYDGGGSGAFYYAALALKEGATYKSTNVMLLGDRIAPQTVEIHDGRAVYNFAERKVGEPMTTPPSVGKSVWINLDAKNNEIGEFVRNFEGEANPSQMTLSMKPWTWEKTESATGTIFTPKKTSAFIITFTKDNKFSAKTDCNGMGGEYVNTANSLMFKNIASTLMYCDDSEETVFSSMLSDVINKEFTSKGELILDLKNSKGKAIFR